jgi:hypothetical protein
MRSSQLPVVEPVASRPKGLDARHKLRPPLSIAQPDRTPSSPLLALACNWAAALFALGVAVAAHRRRRGLAVGAQVLRLPPPAVEHRRASRAA